MSAFQCQGDADGPAKEAKKAPRKWEETAGVWSPGGQTEEVPQAEQNEAISEAAGGKN